jgi:DNA-binding CsgD family transcriptional regulator
VGVATVGRAADLLTVDRVVAAARAGQQQTLLITGEAGIGKSRMLAETRRRAQDAGFTVLIGHAVEGGRTYRPIAEALVGHLRSGPLPDTPDLRPYLPALGRFAPDIAALPEPGIDPTVVLGEAVLRLLVAVDGALLLEDLHWADPDTLALLEYVSGAAVDRPVLVAATSREGVRLRNATHIGLSRLDEGAIRDLAGALGATDVDRVVARADGLPFLVEELAASGSDLPLTFAALVAARLAALSPQARRLVFEAALAGPEWLDPATAREAIGLLAVDGDRLVWRHALTRDAVLAQLLPPERAELARQVADRIEADDEDRAAEVLAAAGEHARAGAILVRLARRDLDRGALKSAAARLDRASRPEHPDWTVQRVRQLTLAGDVPAALDAGASVVDRLAGDAHAELCLQLARTAVVGSRWNLAEQYAERAGRPDDPRTGVIRADAAYGAGDLPRAADAARAAVEQAGSGDPLAAALLVQARVLAHVDPDRSLATFRRAAQVAAEHALTPLRVAALIGEATVLANDVPVPDVLEPARALAEPAGLLGQVVSIDLLRADLEHTAHGAGPAEPIARRAAEQARRLRLSPSEAVASLLVAGCRAGVGDRPGTEEWLQRAESLANAPAEVTSGAAIVRAVAALVAGDFGTAERLADAGASRLAVHRSASPTSLWGPWLVLRAYAGRPSTLDGGPELRRVNRAALGYASAVTLGRAGRLDDAAARFAAADAEFDGYDFWRRLLRAPVLTAAVEDGWGDPVPLLRADLTVNEAESPPLARIGRDLLRRAGAPTRRGRGSSVVPPSLRAAGVTSREMDVLRLVADGLTNAEIAARLFLSRRTVETHVAHLLTKTGARARAQLRTYVST